MSRWPEVQRPEVGSPDNQKSKGLKSKGQKSEVQNSEGQKSEGQKSEARKPKARSPKFRWPEVQMVRSPDGQKDRYLDHIIKYIRKNGIANATPATALTSSLLIVIILFELVTHRPKNLVKLYIQIIDKNCMKHFTLDIAPLFKRKIQTS